MPDAVAGAVRPAFAKLLVADLGLVPYGEALELQRAVARGRIDGSVPEDVLLLLEHPPVITLGRTAKEAHLTASPAFLAQRGVERFEVERGGDVTFHGPGQLVGYPIVDLKRHKQDLHWYLRQVEAALVAGLAELGVPAEASTGRTGVWTRATEPGDTRPSRKIASIGVHARDWVTWHGFALNVSTDLSYFELIVPCGIQGVEMTSVERELESRVDPRSARETVAHAFARTFALELEPIDAAAIHNLIGAAR